MLQMTPVSQRCGMLLPLLQRRYQQLVKRSMPITVSILFVLSMRRIPLERLPLMSGMRRVGS